MRRVKTSITTITQKLFSRINSQPNGGRLSQPVLFVNGDFDQICTITGNRQGDPMREACQDLAVTSLPAGHWLPLERKAELIQAIRSWLQSKKF
jgi:pimeloyl-ACP methyl ester carboxylesterase